MKVTTFRAGLSLVALASTASAQMPSLNEIYASHAGTDDMEYVEVAGPAGLDLTGYMILVVEGEGASAGTLDRAWDLSGLVIPASGFFVAGDTAVVPNDLDIGASNAIENGTETFYLVLTDGPAAVAGLLGTDVDTDDDGITELAALSGASVTLVDLVAMTDLATGDVVYDGAAAVGPDGTFFPAGIFRDGDAPGPWCTVAFLDFDDVANATQPRTPGASNTAQCTVGVASCFGDGSGLPCPCGNTGGPGEGCHNSTIFGGVLEGSGTNSVSADDLVLDALQLPTTNNGLFFMGDQDLPGPFFDGIRCAEGNTLRFLGSIQNSGAQGTMTHTGFVADSGGLIVAGSTWHFQCWTRDYPGSPCGTGGNLTNMYSVTFSP